MERDAPARESGNLNDALMQTEGEFLLILDADRSPNGHSDETLGYFNDRKVALVQTPQYFSNVPADDPLGSQAPLFYGPIQQGKDGWNAAFFAAPTPSSAGRPSCNWDCRVTSRKPRRVSGAPSAHPGGYPQGTQSGNRRILADSAHPRRGRSSNRRAARLDAGDSLSEITYRARRRVDQAVQALVLADVSAFRPT